ncbi:hypothetical protein DFH08DRAFT_675824 [Mycena albidolilacea]|uniref:Uncharacterized protein n=1 Tax=Mycena albidolilacea TaxID=1033008 RepID=A0AAD7AWJ0_9AGAR|nr:hypothetical protein DFH08DRAFT_675824 [Mycena albidolilacea]
MHTSRPSVSSPLANPTQTPGATAPTTPQRAYSFPRSSALRPFPSVVSASGAGKKPVKMIQPPANQRGWFVLNLTQGELGRQE